MTSFFEYVALGILLLGLTMLIYVLVWLHGIPHQIAERNNHPNKHIIHVACWLSVFTLHALWPLVYLWAILPEKKLAVDVSDARYDKISTELEELKEQLAQLKSQQADKESPSC